MFAGLGGLAGGAGSFNDAGFVVAGVVGGSAGWWLALTTLIGLFHAKIDEKAMRMINRVSGVLVIGCRPGGADPPGDQIRLNFRLSGLPLSTRLSHAWFRALGLGTKPRLLLSCGTGRSESEMKRRTAILGLAATIMPGLVTRALAQAARGAGSARQRRAEHRQQPEVPGGLCQAAGRHHPAQRADVPHHPERLWQAARRHRHGQGLLHRQADQRRDLRRHLAGTAGHLQGQQRDPRLDRGAAADARRRSLAAGDPAQSRLWRARRRRRHDPAQPGP